MACRPGIPLSFRHDRERTRFKGVWCAEKGKAGAKATGKLGREGAPRGRTRDPRPVRPCGGTLGLLEQLDLAGRLEAGDAAEVGRRPGLGEAERLGPQTLVAEGALDALAVADQGA